MDEFVSGVCLVGKGLIVGMIVIGDGVVCVGCLVGKVPIVVVLIEDGFVCVVCFVGKVLIVVVLIEDGFLCVVCLVG